MPSKKVQENLIARKRFLAEKYTHMVKVSNSRPRQESYRRKAAEYALKVEQLERQVKK